MAKVRQYAKMVWTEFDVLALRSDWPLERCREWLEENERRIVDRLTEFGYEVLQDLLDTEDAGTRFYDEDDPGLAKVPFKCRGCKEWWEVTAREAELGADDTVPIQCPNCTSYDVKELSC